MSARRLLEKTRARLERETGGVRKSHGGRLRVALAFPSTYYVGMSNLGFQIVYRLLNDRDDVVCERVFLPDEQEIADLQRSGTPLFTMESLSNVKDFDVLAFSLSYELDYPNVLKLLSLCGIEPLAADREPVSRAPLLIAGGPAATFNPEPLSTFIDSFVIGEAEVVLPRLIDTLIERREDATQDLLMAMAQVPGVYVPRLYNPEYNPDGTIASMRVQEGAPESISRQWVSDLQPYAAVSGILTPETEFSNMALAEVARGCGRQCRFCVAGYAFLPARAGSAESVLERLGEARLPEGNQPRVGLLSASVFDHPNSLQICSALIENERLFSISSTRADTLNEDIVNALRKGGHETLTIAPEAGTDRLRRVINKCMNDDDVMRAAEVAWGGGFRRLKLYFMVGLPTEAEEDLEGIISLVHRIAGLHPWERIGVSASCFVPKPWTPFQWASMEEEKLLADKVNRLRKALRAVRRVQMAGESSREAVVQGVLARGDRRVGAALQTFALETGSWKAAFRASGVDPAFYAQRHRYKDELLPWDHLDLGVKKAYLWREYENALRAVPTSACNRGLCKRCGICR